MVNKVYQKVRRCPKYILNMLVVVGFNNSYVKLQARPMTAFYSKDITTHANRIH